MDIKEIMEMTESDRIKLYLSRYKTATDTSPVSKRSARRKRTSEYEVKLSSGLDAVIEKKDKSGDRQLVIMPSQNKYLFKQGEVIQDIDATTENEFAIFFKGLPEEGVAVNNIVIDTITESNVGSLYKMLKEKKEALHDGMMSLSFYNSRLEQFLGSDKKVTKLIMTKTPILSTQEKYGREFITLTNLFAELRGYDAARVFVENYTKSSMKGINDYSTRRRYYGHYGYHTDSDGKRVISEGSLDTKTLIQYLCFGLYAQGFDTIPMATYRDYIQMSIDYEGKIRDKYPEALLTAHDIVSLKCSIHKAEIDRKNFMKSYDDFKSSYDLESNIVFKYKGISLIVPDSSNELIDEGQKLGHCVGSYVSRVSKGECLILFGRRNGNLSESYLTVELRPINEFGKKNYCIAQIQGDMKRTRLTEEEKDFFVKLMDEMKFKTSNSNFDEKYLV